MRSLEGDGLIVMRLFGVGPGLGFQLKSDYEGAQAALLAALLGQQAFIALLAGRVAIDAVDDAGNCVRAM